MLKDWEELGLSVGNDNSLNKYLLSLFLEEGSVLGSWDKAVKNKKGSVIFLMNYASSKAI